MATALASVVTSFGNFTFQGNAYPLHWQVKDGCFENSTILKDTATLYWEDERACQLHDGDLIPGKYAWGICGTDGIRFGYADTYDECLQSMVGEEGFHQVIVPPKEMTEGSCYCMPHAEAGMHSSFTCVKETTTTVPTPRLAKVQASATTPKPHEDDHHHTDTSIIIVVVTVFSFALLSVLLCQL